MPVAHLARERLGGHDKRLRASGNRGLVQPGVLPSAQAHLAGELGARAKSEGIVMGRDTFRRLWRAEGLRVRPRKAPKPRTAPRLQRLVEASAPGHVWAIDFQFDSEWSTPGAKGR